MDNEKNSEYYLNKIISDIEFCINHLENVQLEDFYNDEVINCAVSFKFVQISENNKKMSAEFLEKYSDIPWFKISGLRNRIVHDYGSIQLDIIYYTVKKDLPILYSLLKGIEE